nr:hypothetical protein [Desulfobacula sp.]
MKAPKISKDWDLLSAEALEVLNFLGGKHLRIIQKDYPFKANRNKAIARLKKKGVKIHTLVELTGLNRTSILRIVKGMKKGSIESNESMDRVVELLKELSKEISDIKNHNKKEK